MIDSLQQLIEKAREEKKWLYCYYQTLWFSPDELQDENEKGKFRWGVVNWELRDPAELIEWRKSDVKKAQKELDNVIIRVAKWRAK